MGALIGFLLGILSAVKHIHPVDKTDQTKTESGKPSPVLRAELQIPDGIQAEKKTESRKKRRLDVFMAVVHTLTMLAVVWYAILTNHILDATKNQFRADQRAWIAATVFAEDPEIGKKYGITLKIKNIGKTAAISVRICTLTEFVPSAKYGVPPLHECKDSDWREAGLVPPVGDGTIISYVSPNDKLQNGISMPQSGLTEAEFLALTRVDLYPVHYGKIIYKDIFGCHHWLSFCQIEYTQNGTAWWTVCGKTGDDTDIGGTCNK